MGWSSGTPLAAQLIESAKKNISSKKDRKKFYKDLLDAFEDADWDNVDEVIGIDLLFDLVVYKKYPDWLDDEEDCDAVL